MNTEQKQALMAEAEKALDHDLVTRARDEYVGNMRGYGVDVAGGLPRFELAKVMTYVAIVARAQALGIEPDALRMTEDEGRESDRAILSAMHDSGLPVIVIREDG